MYWTEELPNDLKIFKKTPEMFEIRGPPNIKILLLPKLNFWKGD